MTPGKKKLKSRSITRSISKFSIILVGILGGLLKATEITYIEELKIANHLRTTNPQQFLEQIDYVAGLQLPDEENEALRNYLLGYAAALKGNSEQAIGYYHKVIASRAHNPLVIRTKLALANLQVLNKEDRKSVV